MSNNQRARLSNIGNKKTNMCGNEGKSFFFYDRDVLDVIYNNAVVPRAARKLTPRDGFS